MYTYYKLILNLYLTTNILFRINKGNNKMKARGNHDWIINRHSEHWAEDNMKDK